MAGSWVKVRGEESNLKQGGQALLRKEHWNKDEERRVVPVDVGEAPSGGREQPVQRDTGSGMFAE